MFSQLAVKPILSHHLQAEGRSDKVRCSSCRREVESCEIVSSVCNLCERSIRAKEMGLKDWRVNHG